MLFNDLGESMNCRSCGNAVNVLDKFCGNCGASQSALDTGPKFTTERSMLDDFDLALDKEISTLQDDLFGK